jgi:hypothetical protein
MSTQRAVSGSALPSSRPGISELTADLVDHLEGRIADRGHGDGGDQERDRAADEQADEHQSGRRAPGSKPGMQLHGLDEGRDDGQGRQRRGADGEALADGRGGVAELVQGVGDVRVSSPMPAISAMPPALSATGP